MAQRDVRQFQVGAAGPSVVLVALGRIPRPTPESQGSSGPGLLGVRHLGQAVLCPCRLPLASASESWPAPATALLNSLFTELSRGESPS